MNIKYKRKMISKTCLINKTANMIYLITTIKLKIVKIINISTFNFQTKSNHRGTRIQINKIKKDNPIKIE